MGRGDQVPGTGRDDGKIMVDLQGDGIARHRAAAGSERNEIRRRWPQRGAGSPRTGAAGAEGVRSTSWIIHHRKSALATLLCNDRPVAGLYVARDDTAVIGVRIIGTRHRAAGI